MYIRKDVKEILKFIEDDDVFQQFMIDTYFCQEYLDIIEGSPWLENNANFEEKAIYELIKDILIKYEQASTFFEMQIKMKNDGLLTFDEEAEVNDFIVRIEDLHDLHKKIKDFDMEKFMPLLIQKNLFATGIGIKSLAFLQEHIKLFSEDTEKFKLFQMQIKSTENRLYISEKLKRIKKRLKV